jgi:hypothetical protein
LRLPIVSIPNGHLGENDDFQENGDFQENHKKAREARVGGRRKCAAVVVYLSIYPPTPPRPTILFQYFTSALRVLPRTHSDIRKKIHENEFF